MEKEIFLFTIPESAESLRISRSTIYRLIAAGDIETITVRGIQRIRPIALQRFVENQQHIQRERVAIEDGILLLAGCGLARCKFSYPINNSY